MKGSVEGTVCATLWMPGNLLANLTFATALESPAADWSNLQAILGWLFLCICKNMQIYEVFYKTAVIAVQIAERNVKAEGMVL